MTAMRPPPKRVRLSQGPGRGRPLSHTSRGGGDRASAVLRSQQQVGNAAVGRLLREAAAPVQTAADLDRQYNNHLNESPPNWDEAARDLNGFSDEDIKVRVGQLRRSSSIR